MTARNVSLERHAAGTLRKRLEELQPPETEADRLRAYRDDPVRFAVEVLGMIPTRLQRTILEAVRDNKRVSVRSGRRVGKSYVFAALALWFYCTQGPDARVVLMATTDRQVKGIMWRAIEMLYARAKIRIPGVKAESHEGGLVWKDLFCEIKGYTGRDAEAIAGIAGARLMYLIDEASGVKQQIFDAIEGNLAGGDAWLCLIGNPTRNEGEFYESHHKKSAAVMGPEFGYCTIAVPSTCSPNITGEWRELSDKMIPGMAKPAWIELMKRTWGEDSAQYRVHVLGEFAINEERKLFSLALLHEAHERHAIKSDEEGYIAGEGRLWIGLDPAGPGGQGDESAIVLRRGQRVIDIWRGRGLSADGHVAQVLALISAHRLPAEKLCPAIVYDAGGDVGRDVGRALVDHLDRNVNAFDLVKTFGSWKPQRLPLVYVTLRDEMAANAERWCKAGGALPEDIKLERDLHVLEFDPATKDRLQLIKKDGPNGIRTLLGRSSDTGDAFILSCWEPARLADEKGDQGGGSSGTNDPGEGFDPYRGIDPYGGEINPYG